LRRDVEEHADLIQLAFLVCLVNLVRAETVRVRRSIIARLVDAVIELGVVEAIKEGHIEGIRRIGQGFSELRAHDIVAIACHIERLVINVDALLVGVEPCAHGPWR